MFIQFILAVIKILRICILDQHLTFIHIYTETLLCTVSLNKPEKVRNIFCLIVF